MDYNGKRRFYGVPLLAYKLTASDDPRVKYITYFIFKSQKSTSTEVLSQ